jgi:protocatechuate 4,5-dioxygenase alpha chain
MGVFVAIRKQYDRVMSHTPDFTDIPGTYVFTGDRAMRGRHLNRFCMSLMNPANRARFKADERAYLDEWQMTEAQKQAVLRRDFEALLELGGNIFFVLKIAAVDGRTTQSVAASLAGQSAQEFATMMRNGGRNPQGLRSVSGRY